MKPLYIIGAIAFAATPALADQPGISHGLWVSQQNAISAPPFHVSISVVPTGAEIVIRDQSKVSGASALDVILVASRLPICVYAAVVDGWNLQIKAEDRARSTSANCPFIAQLSMTPTAELPELTMSFRSSGPVTFRMVNTLAPPSADLEDTRVVPDVLGVAPGMSLVSARKVLEGIGFIQLEDAADRQGNRIVAFGRTPLSGAGTNLAPNPGSNPSFMDHVYLEASKEGAAGGAIVLAVGRELVFPRELRPTADETLGALREKYGAGETRRGSLIRFTATFDAAGNIGATECGLNSTMYADFAAKFEGIGLGANGSPDCPVQVDSYLTSSDGKPFVDRIVLTIADYLLLHRHRWAAFNEDVTDRLAPFLDSPSPTGNTPEL